MNQTSNDNMRKKKEDFERFSVTSFGVSIFLLLGMTLKGEELQTSQMLLLVLGTLLFSSSSLYFLVESKKLEK